MKCRLVPAKFVTTLVAVASAVLFSNASTALALVVRDYDAARHERFSAGFPANPIRNETFFLSEFDFSGVGWGRSSAFNVTLISPQHFIGAAHTNFRPGQTVDFFNREGVLKSYTVETVRTIPKDAIGNTDLFIGKLTAPIPAADEIGFYPLLRLPQDVDYLQQPVVLYGKGGRVGTSVIDLVYRPDVGGLVGSEIISLPYAQMTAPPDGAHNAPGDSGSPSFVVADGHLALVGTSSLGGGTEMQFTDQHMFVPRYLDRLNDEMASTGFRVTTIPAAAANVRNVMLSFIQDATNDVLATANFVGTLPFDRFELESLDITAAGSAALETTYGTRLPIGPYAGTFSATHVEFTLNDTGTKMLSGQVSSKDAPDRFGGNTGDLSFSIHETFGHFFGFTDEGRVPGSRIGGYLGASAAGRWVVVIPEPDAWLLILLGATIATLGRRKSAGLRVRCLSRHEK